MRPYLIPLPVVLALSVWAQEVEITPTEELRVAVSEWVETMRKIQVEENEWARDQEVLQNYREGLENEIAELKEQIASAQTRKEGADKESLDKSTERDRFAAAKDELAKVVRRLEEELLKKSVIIPTPLREEPKVAQGLEELQRSLELPADKQGEGVSKRLLNVINLTTEIEKFQQTVVLRPELHKDAQGREFNMQVIYFGLAAAYAVNDDSSLALVGHPGTNGWVFEERKDLATDITRLIAATTGDEDAAFINLPFSKP